MTTDTFRHQFVRAVMGRSGDVYTSAGLGYSEDLTHVDIVSSVPQADMPCIRGYAKADGTFLSLTDVARAVMSAGMD
jgi:hypothetical protein